MSRGFHFDENPQQPFFQELSKVNTLQASMSALSIFFKLSKNLQANNDPKPCLGYVLGTANYSHSYKLELPPTH